MSTGITETEALFLEALRCAIHGERVSWEELPTERRRELLRLARAQSVTPLFAEAVCACPAFAGTDELRSLRENARQITVRQAARTAEFLLLLRELNGRGLRPQVMKGAVCRSLYPEPEQRPSIDEDLLILPGEYPVWHEALLACGLRLMKPEKPTEDADEVPYVDPARELYLELHMRLFSRDSEAYSDCNACLEGAQSRREKLCLYGETLDTLQATDHLLFLLCHAYKHLLHGGVGVRQICDLCLFAQRWGGEIDWARVRRSCGELRIETLAAAFFQIGERRLGISAPAAFAEIETDEEPLLRDCLRGGLYGANDLDRLHSANLTLDAVGAEKKGKRRRGALHALFLPASSLRDRYPFLRKRPWLLPAAWTMRLVGYLRSKTAVDPGRTLQIGQERIELLRQYRVLS